MNCDQSSPHGEINVVGALNVHRNSHRRRMGDERVSRMTCLDDETCTDRLLAEVIVENPLLDKFHYMLAKKSHNRQVHARVHKPERIACRNDAIKVGKSSNLPQTISASGCFRNCQRSTSQNSDPRFTRMKRMQVFSFKFNEHEFAPGKFLCPAEFARALVARLKKSKDSSPKRDLRFQTESLPNQDSNRRFFSMSR
jgi:hypothetical protein